jgi:6-phosphofructokinase 1
MRIGVLTAGGDAPGLNAAVRALGRRALERGDELYGIRDGWSGLLGDTSTIALTRDSLSGVINEGGTLLGSIRIDLDHPSSRREEILANIAERFDAVVAMGGDGTLGVAQWLAERGAHIVGVPKTLDNDLSNTEYCIGFDTAVGVVAEALDRLHTTAASHHRVMVLETMGRDTGWVATMGALAGGADYLVIPEFPSSMQEICAHVRARHERGSAFSIVVVAEGSSLESLGGHTNGELFDPLGQTNFAGHGVGHFLADRIALETGFETRATVLGYVQRGGSPSAYDRIWATHVGSSAYDAVAEKAWGTVPVVQGGRVKRVDLCEVTREVRSVPRELYELCSHFF